MRTKMWLGCSILFLIANISVQSWATEGPTSVSSQTPVIIPNSDLLQPQSPWEFSVQPTYGSEAEQNPQVFGATVTARQSFQILPVDIRYRAGNCNTLALHIPYLRREEELGVAAETTSTTDFGLGDMVVGIEHGFKSPRMCGWEGQVGLTLRLPTGKNVYDNLPDDELPMGIGHYETGVNLCFRRLTDPVVVNAGLDIGYLWPRERNGEEVRPGIGFTLKTGIGYALSDRWIVTEELEFLRQPNVFLQNALTAITESVDQAYITHGFLYNKSRNCPSYCLLFSVGLNNQSTDFLMTIGRQR